mmetsp:Transcript_22947/g.49974  ORF Transcript_22947/g.49974 Transcript_22947/m.49974 type:complete len:437 (-) Transcript_22947:242-1552(-)
MSDSDSNSSSKRSNQKRTHSHSASSAKKKISDSKKNKSENSNVHDQKRVPSTSRLQVLQDYNIIDNVMIFLDETSLFQLENTHSNMIGQLSFVRQWSYLSICDERRISFSHRRWRSLTPDDIEAVVDDMDLSTNIKSDVSIKDYNDSNSNNCNNPNSDDGETDQNTSLPDFPYSREFIARQIGRNFSEEAIFVHEREKEASRIYNFDCAPANDSDIPIWIGHSSSTDIDSSSTKSCPSSLISKEEEHHWYEWYDYRVNSVNKREVFVRLSLRDGSRRFWHGFRRLTTNHNKTSFRMHFDMKELIRDMRWIELEAYLKSKDTSYTSVQNRLKAIAPLMRMTQLTVSLGGKLLMATGGYSDSFFGGYAVHEGYFFHSRNYRFPLSRTTENDLQWKPYRIHLTDNSVKNELAIQFDCDHHDLPFMRAEDIGNPNAHAHW